MATVYLFIEDASDTTGIACYLRSITSAAHRQPIFERAPVSSLPRAATVEAEEGTINIYAQPSASAPVLARVPDAATLGVYARAGEWYFVHYLDIQGYVNAAQIVLQY